MYGLALCLPVWGLPHTANSPSPPFALPFILIVNYERNGAKSSGRILRIGDLILKRQKLFPNLLDRDEL